MTAESAGGEPVTALADAPAVRIVGPGDVQSAFGVVNRRWSEGLAGTVRLVDDATTVADVAIHQDWQSRFGEGPFPPARRRVAVRPWDFGPYPRRWVEVVSANFDELWVHSTWARRCAVAAGIDASAVRAVPLGVDPAVMCPDGALSAIVPEDHVVFLFAGAAVVRKGVDVALAAYRDAFDAGDRVCLVVKDHTGDVFYDRQTLRDEILAAADDPAGPRIVYIDEYLPDDGLAALYRRADLLVAPYRAEGFSLPILEAMACGTVPLVPRFGACLDYCDDETALFVEPRRIRLPYGRELATNTLGSMEVVDEVDFCEVPADRLAVAMRDAAAAGRDTLRARGRSACRVARHWTWDRSVAAVEAAVRELVA